MEIKFQNEGKKDLWNNFKASKIDDSFSKEIIEYTESCIINMQEEIEKQGEEVLIEINWKVLERKVFEAKYKSIEEFQNALDRVKLHETDFQWIIKKSLKLAQPQNITEKQKECAIKFISSFWKYGEKFNQEIERIKEANKVLEDRKKKQNPVMYLSPKAKRGL